MESIISHPENRMIRWIIALILVLPIAIGTFHRHEFQVDIDEPKVYSVESSWWGLRQKWREIRWMKPKGYDSSSWCARKSDGSWYPYVYELPDDDRPIDD